MSVDVRGATTSALPSGELDRWREVPVSVIVDLDASIRQVDPSVGLLPCAGRAGNGARPVLFGRAVTARCEPPDFGAVLHAIDRVGPGEVLVIAAGGVESHAMIGDVLGGHLRAKGAAGIVCDGAVRDTRTLASWSDFPVYRASINPRGPTGATRGAVNVPVTVAGCEVRPGDLIVGDADGLAALSDEDLRTWIGAAEARLETEAGWVRRLADGEGVGAVFDLPAA